MVPNSENPKPECSLRRKTTFSSSAAIIMPQLKLLLPLLQIQPLKLLLLAKVHKYRLLTTAQSAITMRQSAYLICMVKTTRFKLPLDVIQLYFKFQFRLHSHMDSETVAEVVWFSAQEMSNIILFNLTISCALIFSASCLLRLLSRSGYFITLFHKFFVKFFTK